MTLITCVLWRMLFRRVHVRGLIRKWNRLLKWDWLICNEHQLHAYQYHALVNKSLHAKACWMTPNNQVMLLRVIIMSLISQSTSWSNSTATYLHVQNMNLQKWNKEQIHKVYLCSNALLTSEKCMHFSHFSCYNKKHNFQMTFHILIIWIKYFHHHINWIYLFPWNHTKDIFLPVISKWKVCVCPTFSGWITSTVLHSLMN